MSKLEKKLQGSLAGFLIPSIIGIFFFMIPIRYDGNWTILVKILANFIAELIGNYSPEICVGVVTISTILGIIFLGKPNFIATYPVVANTFSTTAVWVVIRIISAVFIWLTYLGIKSENNESGLISMITSSQNGGFILYELLTSLIVVFFLAGFLLPFLLDFGLLEFIGALLTKFMRPLFRIPGRAAVDCITSWIGDGTLGVMLTANQYEKGYYSAREAAIISTTFSAVSITFSILILAQVDLMEYFGLYYFLICSIGIICALVLPRIPPLSFKKDKYMIEVQTASEDIPKEYSSSFEYGIALAQKKAGEYKGISQFLKNALKNASGMWFGVLPLVMCIGTISLILTNHTKLFSMIGLPFMPLLNLLRIPEAEAVSQTLIVGFTEVLTPTIIASNLITSPMARFIVAVVSVTQVIFLAETGGVILSSKIPVSLLELFLIFLERTIISLLITAPIARLFFTT